MASHVSEEQCWKKINTLKFSCKKYFWETIYDENKQWDLNCDENRQNIQNMKKCIIIKNINGMYKLVECTCARACLK